MSATTELPGSFEPVLERADPRYRYVRAALVSGVGGLVARFFQGLTPVALARILGHSEYGVYALLMSVLAMVAGTAHLGQNMALQKFLPEYAAKDPERGKSILISSIWLVGASIAVMGLLLLITAHSVAESLYHDVTLAGKLRFIVLLVIATAIFNLLSSISLGLQDVQTYTMAVIVRSGTFLVGGSIGALLWGIEGAIAGQLVAVAIAVLILTIASCRVTRVRFPVPARGIFRRDIIAELIGFGVPALLAGFVVAVGVWWANTTLVRGSGYEQLADFGVGWALLQLIVLLPSSLSTPAVSFMSEVHAVRGKHDFSRFVSDNLRIIWSITLPICFTCALCAEKLVIIGFGIKYVAAVPLARWMSLTALLISVSSQIGLAISSLGKMWEALLLNLTWLIVFVLLAWVAAPLGARGLVYAYCLSHLFFAVLVWKYSEKALGIYYQRLIPMMLLSILVVTLAELIGPHPLYGLGWTRLLLVIGLLVVEWTWVLRDGEKDRIRQAVGSLYLRFLECKFPSRTIQEL